ncbi:Susd and RagB outer membrane lipoprotein [Flavobacterium gillisiae]|uniref:Susd and RagB outer membrane lipoprotein n=1 Tax=Flavobacterium gillisiae TaxID=150146 RepID=A0A1H4CP88_9FLAO|nr:SusD/RagB family nutrient-binding outer membrane lipoprotein [Flavobacterium gillisiae]SEA62211.1 Susd and RagB outer membrane lipoprotein [Flavobacterium gillisiae]
MKKYIKQIICSTLLLSLLGCDQYLDINEDPNVSTDVPAELLLKGMELADVQIQSGHLMRISQFWTGQMKGTVNLYGRINDYIISPEDSNDAWAFMYHGIMTQNDVIQKNSQDELVKGIANVIEAHGIGSMASMFGDVPYSKVGVETKAAFDGQLEVYKAAQDLLSTAITQLSSVSTTRRFTNDILLGGNPIAWIQVANSLKARYYMMTRQYPEAYQSALLGVKSKANSLRFAAGFAGYGTTRENSNLYNLILTGSRSGDLTSTGSFMQNLLDVTKTSSRNNSKTTESRRRDYLIVDQTGINSTRISAVNALTPLVSYEENLLILAEAGYRTVGFNEGLIRLNALRAYLATGTAFAGNPILALKYDAYVSTDFDAGGIENKDNVTANKALLREIVEEKYVSCFGTLVPFDDSRRIRSTDNDIALPIPINSGTAYPERFLIAQDEINGNEFAPSPIPGLFVKTPVNQ